MAALSVATVLVGATQEQAFGSEDGSEPVDGEVEAEFDGDSDAGFADEAAAFDPDARVAVGLDATRDRVSRAEALVDQATAEREQRRRRLEAADEELAAMTAEADAIAARVVQGAIRHFRLPDVSTNIVASRDLNAAVRADRMAASALVADEPMFTRFWRHRHDLDISMAVQELRRERFAGVVERVERLESAMTADVDLLVELEERSIQQGARQSSVAVSTWAQNLGTRQGFYLQTCPIDGAHSFVDSWGFARSGGRRHKGVDMLARIGTPIVSPVNGRVEHYTNRVGGRSFRLWDEFGNYFYGTHLSGFADSGQVVAGQLIGYVGDDGNAAGIPHLHFEIHAGGQGRQINPFIDVAAVCDGAQY